MSFDRQFGDIEVRPLRSRQVRGQSTFVAVKIESMPLGATFLRYDSQSFKYGCESVGSSGMMSITRISIDQAKEMLRTRADVQIVDIRDAHAYGAAHIPGSTHLSEQNLEQFIQETQSDIALIVMCYHGISSQSASAYLSNRGFSETYSLDGGFEAWQRSDGT